MGIRLEKHMAVILLGILVLSASAGCRANADVEETTLETWDDLWVVRLSMEDYLDPARFEGMARSPLTGEWIDEEIAARRPVAVTINNSTVALPQSGLSQAEVMFETLAEGNITRLIAVFQDLDVSRIGAVRSARHYFIDFAFDYDALFVHYGGSPQAYNDVVVLGSPSLNGLSWLDGLLTWRDPDRLAIRGMYEHSVFTSGERILESWDRVGYREEFSEDWAPHFRFATDEFVPDGIDAHDVTVPYSRSYPGRFVYDEDTGRYWRFQSGNPHVDEEQDVQLSVKNILVQSTRVYVIPGDDAGRRNVETVGRGEGVYISNGRAVPVTWERSDRKAQTVWRDEQGNTLTINPGNLWICVLPDHRDLIVE